MQRPSFQFYPADWRKDPNLRRCSEAARGAWMDVLCLLHESEEYGVLRWPLAEIARAAGVKLKFLCELFEKKVIKGSDGKIEDFVYIPRHAGINGEPVILIKANEGPCWYSSRFVRDEYVRNNRGKNTRFSGKKRTPKVPPMVPPTQRVGVRQGDGSSSTSTIEENIKEKFLDFVELTQEQYQKLVGKLGKARADEYIERLNNYIGSKGKRYNSHYHTILSWSGDTAQPLSANSPAVGEVKFS